MKTRSAILLGACAAFIAVGVACAIDESGDLPGDDASTGDSTTPDTGIPDVVHYDVLADVPLPPSCSTLDTTCVGFDAGLPNGWTAFVEIADGGGCPVGDFSGTSWVTNTRLGAGSCACSCVTSGTYTCPSLVNVIEGNACAAGANTIDGGCQSNGGNSLELVDAATATGTASCVSDAAPPIPQADPVTLCSVGCEAGVGALCSQPTGSRCIVADGIQTCPGNLSPHYIGASADPSCGTCGCKPSDPGRCTATAHVYHGYFNGYYHGNDNCSTGGMYSEETLTLDGGCQFPMAGFDSYDVSWGTPTAPSCTTSLGSGDAGLASPKTVCCN